MNVVQNALQSFKQKNDKKFVRELYELYIDSF